MRLSRRLARSLTLTLALALMLAACGRSGSSVEAGLRPLVLSAVQASTEAAETAHTSVVVRVDMRNIPDEADQSFEVTAEGAVDIANERARFVVDFPQEMADGGTPLAGTMEIIVDGDVAYVRMPDGTTPAGKPWVRMSGEGLDMTGMGFGGLGSTFDTGLNLEMLDLGEPTAVETVGREDVRGVSTIHYRVTVQPSESEDLGDSEAFMQIFAGGESLVYDVWVDEDDRLRRMTFSIDLAAMMKAMFEGFAATFGEMGGEEAPSTTTFPDMSMLMSLEMEVWDFGEPVDIQIPPADHVTDGA